MGIIDQIKKLLHLIGAAERLPVDLQMVQRQPQRGPKVFQSLFHNTSILPTHSKI
jgi:hypothetical protein